MDDFFQLFSTQFMPHGHCYFWNPLILWLNVVSDGLIAVSYYSIPIALLYLVRKREDLAFDIIFVLFAVFILACGTTHIMEIWNVWDGKYLLTGIIKLVTAVASVVTSILLWKLIPQALRIPSKRTLEEANSKLNQEIVQRAAAEEEIRKLNRRLEEKVIYTTDELNKAIEEGKGIEKKLAIEQKYFRYLADAMPHVVWTARPDGFVDYYNQRWYDLTGQSENSSSITRWRDVTHPEDLQRTYDSWHAAINSGDPYEIEYRLYQSSTQEYKWHLGRALPVRNSNGEIVRWLGTSTDIDIQKKADELKMQLLAGERANRTIIEHASKMKDEFLATLSHELRTPLNAILGWAQLLKGKKEGREFAQGLEVIERNARAQAQLIADLLDMSTIISGKVKIKPQEIQVSPFVQDALESVRPTAEAKQITLRSTIDSSVSSVHADIARLHQVVWNLLVNAIKFTPKGGMVQIAVKGLESYLQIRITDSGKGIDPEVLPFIFDRFRQGDSSTTRNFGGLGLGLSIAKNLVELHAGILSATSDGEGKGSAFEILLPLYQPVELAPKPKHEVEQVFSSNQPVTNQSSTGSLKNIVVLAVDNEHDARVLIQKILEEYGAQVVTAESAEQGLSILKNFKPDIVISDIGMPVQDGYAFMRKIRSLSATDGGNIPAVALTAFARSEEHDLVIQAGYQAHVTKPVEPAELVTTILGLIGSQQ